MTTLEDTTPLEGDHEDRPQSRVVLVGRTGWDARLRLDPTIELLRPRTPIEAVGEVASLGVDALAAKTTVIVSPHAASDLEHDTESAAQFVRALREACPGVRILVQPEEGAWRVKGHFDGVATIESIPVRAPKPKPAPLPAAPVAPVVPIAPAIPAATAPEPVAPPQPAPVPAAPLQPAATVAPIAPTPVAPTPATPTPVAPAPVAPAPTPPAPVRTVYVPTPPAPTTAPTPAPTPAPIARPTPPPIPARPAADARPPLRTPVHTTPAPQPPPAQQRETQPARTPAPPSLAAMTGTPGDGALVDALLRGGAHLADAALQVLRVRTGDPSVTFIPASHATDLDWASDALCPVTQGSRAFGLLGSRGTRPLALLPHARWLAGWLALSERTQQLEDAALRDPLTGAHNRRYFDATLEATLDEARRTRQSVTVLVFDIDNFKRYNDRYGHAAGDEILTDAIRLLRSVTRPHDTICRIGGDEFAVIFHDVHGPRHEGSQHPASIAGIAERFQAQVRAHRFPKLLDLAPGTLTVSGGLATFPWDGDSAHALLQRADERALASKRQGKNQLTFGAGAGDEVTR